MYFFDQYSGPISQSTPLGQWDVSGYQQVAMHAWAKGPGATTLYLELYFNNMSAAQEKLTIGPAAPGSWNIVTLAKVYAVFAPKLSIVLYNPSAQIDFTMRLYAACCEAKSGLASLRMSLGQLLTGTRSAASGEGHRKLSATLNTNDLLESPTQPPSDQAPTPQS